MAETAGHVGEQDDSDQSATAAEAGRSVALFPYRQVSRWLVEGSIVPFLGAGASIAGVDTEPVLPTGAGLASELIDMMSPAYVGSKDDELPKVAQVFERSIFDRSALYNHIRERFYESQRSADLGAVPAMLARAPHGRNPLYIVSTNYDDQVERAFHDAGRPLTIVTQTIKMKEGQTRVIVQRDDRPPETVFAQDLLLDDTRPGAAVLYKMHGSATRPATAEHDGLVITEDDYVDFLVLSGGASATIMPPPGLTTAFRRKRFLFLGYSLQDWNLRMFLRLLAVRQALSDETNLRHWAVQRNPSALEAQLWAHRNVTLYNGDLVDFCDGIESQWTQGGP